MFSRDSQALQSKVRLDLLNLFAELDNFRRQATGSDNLRLTAWPFGFDAPHDSVDALGSTKQHTCPNTILRSPANHSRRRSEFCSREFCCPTRQLIRSSLQSRCNHTAQEPTVTCDTIKGGGSTKVHDNGIALVHVRRGQRVDDTVRSHLHGILNIEHHRKIRRRPDFNRSRTND